MRGPHPDDARLFADPSRLTRCGDELAWLLGRGYPVESALTFVGDHHQLHERQRIALRRSTCSDADRALRMGKCVVDVRGRHVLLDAFNVLVTIETALGGGFVFVGRDGAMRDLAGLRGSYRVVEETERALAIVADVLGEAASLEWLLDAPIANSGRLRARIEAFHFACPSTARVLANPDAELKEREFVASSDALVLDRCVSWAPVSRWAVERVPGARVVRL